MSIKADGSYYLNGSSSSINRSDLESKLQIEMEKQNEKILYLQVDQVVPTGQTVELIGLAKANSWKVMLGANPKK